MSRQQFLDLAASGLRMPIGTDLVLHETPDPDAVLTDAVTLGRVIETAARTFRTPLALPQMDLTLEKTELLLRLGIPAEEIPKYHFGARLDDDIFTRYEYRRHEPFHARLRAHVGSIEYIAQRTDLLPIGMVIGPFSLMTRLLAEPIVPVYLAGMGATAEEEPAVGMVETVLELSTRMVLQSVEAQLNAGARAVFVAEPAANRVYISPLQILSGSDVFERFVVRPNLRIKQRLDDSHADLIFHCCGELSDEMLLGFTRLEPVMLSLGSSRVLWKDAARVPKDIVLFGNLPSKKFYSDHEITCDQVRALSRELIDRMRATGHPFILGTECDVLSVPQHHATIKSKVAAFMDA